MNPGTDDMPLQQAKDYNKEIVRQIREDKINGGFTFDNHIYDSDARSRNNIVGAVTLCIVCIANNQSLPEGFAWRTADNQNVSFTNPQDFINLSLAMFQHLNTCYQVSWMHKYNIDNFTEETRFDLYDYDVTTDWPGF